MALALSRSPRFATALLVALTSLVVGTFVIDYVPLLNETISSALDNMGTVIAALVTTLLCIAAAASAADRRTRDAWFLLSAAFAACAIGEALWFWYQSLAQVAMPFPSLADFFYLALYPFAFVGIMLLLKPGLTAMRQAVMVFDSLLFTLAVSGLAWQLILAPTLADTEDLSRLGVVLSVAYPSADLLLVFGIALLFLSWDLRNVRAPALLLFAGILVMVAADLGFAWQVLQAEYDSSSLLDPWWTVSYVLLALAAFAQLRSNSQTVADHPETRVGNGIDLRRARIVRLLLPYLALPAAGFLFTIHLVGDHAAMDPDALVVFGYALALLVLVLTRQFLSLLENDRLSRSLAARTTELDLLNRVATGLSHCLQPDEVVTTGLDRAAEALRTELGAVWVKDKSGLKLMATLPPAIGSPLFTHLTEHSAAVRATADSESPLAVRLADAAEPLDCLGHELRQRVLVVAPLAARGSTLGALGLVLPPGESADAATLQMVQAMGAQMGVAFGNAQQFESARYLSERDSLTGLLNRRAFQARLEDLCIAGEYGGSVFSVVMMDLDGFKALNDTLGHQGGDEALRQVAAHLRSSLRATDILGRYGGDEFVAVLQHTESEDAIALCERLRNDLSDERMLVPQREPMRLWLSYGVASFPADGLRPDALIGLADRHLYASKQRSGGQIPAGNSAGAAESIA
ncbi:MAG: GGDEF domain-containing protein [Thermoleophilia bacterium]